MQPLIEATIFEIYGQEYTWYKATESDSHWSGDDCLLSHFELCVIDK